MAQVKKKKGTIGILTGGGDVPGLNPAIRAVTIRAIREGLQVIGLRNGWKGLISMVRDKKAHQEDHFQILTEEGVNKVGRTGGTFLHTSRTRPSHVSKEEVPNTFRINTKTRPTTLPPKFCRIWIFWGLTI
jgi:6-phosphofructokinase 1